MSLKVTVAGVGPGSDKYQTGKLKELIKKSDVIMASERIRESIGSKALLEKIKACSVTETLAYISKNKKKDENLLVLATGDTGFYSIAATIARKAPHEVSVEFSPGISSMQYFAAATGHGYEEMRLISLHGREGSLVPYVCYNRSVFALTGGKIKTGDIIKDLIQAGLTEVTVYVGENLTLKDERILWGRPMELAEEKFSDLAVMIVDNDGYTDRYHILEDEEFVRGNVPMTKKAIRTLGTAALEIAPTDVVWDIGSGTGAMTCAMALKASKSFVYAVEKNEEGIMLATANMEKLGIRNIRLRLGEAPDTLGDLPAPDKVFIGGSSGNLAEIVREVFIRNPEAIILITAVSLRTLSEALGMINDMDLEHEVSCANISNARKLGDHELMLSENPIYLIKIRK